MNKLKITCGLLVAALLAFLLVDCIAGHTHYFECTVADHHYVPPSMQIHTSVDEHGNVSMWTTYIPEDYQLLCDQLAGSGSFWVSVSRYSWDTTTNGEYVTIRTRQGRWTKHQWLPTISK